ncbi:MAG: hypothetical protein HQ582_32885 [Planctomycetes bacterium]|nr:hypothetical protein [Planctomycetota bacterium]
MTAGSFDRFVWFLGLVCLVAAGCGGGDDEPVVRASGRITAGGRPLHVEGRESGAGAVEIKFLRIESEGEEAAQAAITQADADGHFEVPGADGNGIPPGKYRIAIRQWDPYPQIDKLGGKFDEENTPITRQITGEEEILIDVLRPGG